MTSHAQAITELLPTLYRDGELVLGLAELLGLQLEVVDEEARAVQSAHWFDTTVERNEAGALGTLLGVGIEPWQSLDEYRAWFHALRTARVRDGAVTLGALRGFVAEYARQYQEANRLLALAPFGQWANVPVRTGHAVVENPPATRTARFGGLGAIEPLARQVVTNDGLDATALSLLYTGTGAGEYVPVLVNVSTGDALVHLDAIGPGEHLWVVARDDGTVTAQQGAEDVTHRLRRVSRVTPGTPWEPSDVSEAPAALMLRPGENDLWFLPVAHFDAPGLDRVLLALADLDLHQGRWDHSAFDGALFHQEPGVVLDLAWTELVPAAVRVDLDAAVLRFAAGDLDAALATRDELAASLGRGVHSLAAAGVRTEVRMRPLHDSQRQRDRLVFVSGRLVPEAGTVGIDRLRQTGGLYGLTWYDESTYQ